jgi:hypothetical protein
LPPAPPPPTTTDPDDGEDVGWLVRACEKGMDSESGVVGDDVEPVPERNERPDASDDGESVKWMSWVWNGDEVVTGRLLVL